MFCFVPGIDTITLGEGDVCGRAEVIEGLGVEVACDVVHCHAVWI